MTQLNRCLRANFKHFCRTAASNLYYHIIFIPLYRGKEQPKAHQRFLSVPVLWKTGKRFTMRTHTPTADSADIPRQKSNKKYMNFKQLDFTEKDDRTVAKIEELLKHVEKLVSFSC